MRRSERVKRTVAAALALAGATACVQHHAPAATAPAVTAVAGTAGESRWTFSARLAAGDSAVAAPDERRPSGTLRVTFRPDHVLEYQLTIVNAESNTYGSGFLYRTGERASRVPVATLFTDMSLSGRHIQLRGTGTIDRPLDATRLLAELRRSPASFAIGIAPARARGVELTGTLR